MHYKEKIKYEPKPLFVERMTQLLGSKETKEFFDISYTDTPDSIRCNTLKISPDELKKRLEKKAWQIKQPFKEYPEIMIIENSLGPGELGNSEEHLLGYYYVQEISSMLPILALKPTKEDSMLD